MKLNDLRKAEIRQMNSCQQAKHAKLYVLTYSRRIKRNIWYMYLRGTKRILISAVAVPHIGKRLAECQVWQI